MEPTLEDFETYDVDESHVERSLLPTSYLDTSGSAPILEELTPDPAPFTEAPLLMTERSIPSEPNTNASSEIPLFMTKRTIEQTQHDHHTSHQGTESATPLQQRTKDRVPTMATVECSDEASPEPEPSIKEDKPQRCKRQHSKEERSLSDASPRQRLRAQADTQTPTLRHHPRPQRLPDDKADWNELMEELLPKYNEDSPSQLPPLSKGDTFCGWIIFHFDMKDPMRFIAQVSEITDDTVYIIVDDPAGSFFSEPLLSENRRISEVQRVRFDDALPMHIQRAGVFVSSKDPVGANEQADEEDEPLINKYNHTTATDEESPSEDEVNEICEDEETGDDEHLAAFLEDFTDLDQTMDQTEQVLPQHETTESPKEPHQVSIGNIGPFTRFNLSPEPTGDIRRILFFDGGARTSKDRKSFETSAAAFVCFELIDGCWQKTFAQSTVLGPQSHNVAEHSGLLCCLKYCSLHQIVGRTIICGDSLLALEQVGQYYKTDAPNLVPLVGRSIALLKILHPTVSIHHFMRSLVNPADELCTTAMNEASGAKWSLKPTSDDPFAAITATENEPAHTAHRKIKRLFSRRKHQGNTSASTKNTGQRLTELTPDQARCKVLTFWKVQPGDASLLAQCLTRTIADISSPDKEAALDAYRRFFLLPQSKLLRTGGKRFTGRRDMQQRLRDESKPEAAQAPHRKMSADFLEKKIRAAQTFASGGELGKAARVLERCDETLPENAKELLAALHPPTSMTEPPVKPSEEAIITVSKDKLLEVMRKLAKMKSPGPSGWTEDLLWQACNASEEALQLVSVMIRDIINNTIPPDVEELIIACRLIPIPKQTKIRPVTIPEAILKIAEAYAMAVLPEDVIQGLDPFQRAFVSGGTECTIHEIRAMYSTGASFVCIDSANAFNTLARTEIFKAVEGIPVLRQLVYLMYANPSPLHNSLFAPGELTSREGTRQGGVLSSLLFCLCIQDVLRQVSAAYPLTTIKAYMDDIILCGSDADLLQAVPLLTTLLGTKGLSVNPTKSSVVSADPRLAASLGFSHKPDGTRVLGSWIGSGEATRQFLVKELQRSEPFFDCITSMDTAYGTPIMTKCGVPRANHICRTTTPLLTSEYVQRFDERTLRTFASLNGIKPSAIGKEQRTIIHLPIGEGGTGVTQYSFIAEVAYKASLSGKQAMQKQLTSKVNKILKAQLSKPTQAQLRLQKDAPWVTALTPNPHYHQAIKHRTLTLGVTGIRFCDCGREYEGQEFIDHVLGCAKVRGQNCSTRHTAVKLCILRHCRYNGIPVSCEPIVVNGESEDTCHRADLKISLRSEDLYIDVVVGNLSCRSHAKKSFSKLEAEKCQIKDNLYLAHVQKLGGRFSAFFVEVNGRLGSTAAAIVRKLERASIMPKAGELRNDLSATLARLNGAILTGVLRD